MTKALVIRGTDRVSTVLARDESLVEVFAGLSPAFERLRSPGMRRVMSRLVTVEQAARMAGVDAGELVTLLNERIEDNGRTPDDREMTRAMNVEKAVAHKGQAAGGDDVLQTPASVNEDRPAELAAIADDCIVSLDVREELRMGREPFSMIMAARRTVPDGGALSIRATFEPVPLYAVMKRQGLTHWTEELAADDWRVWFYPALETPAATADDAVADDRVARAQSAGTPAVGQAAGSMPAPDAADAESGMVIIDVRGLEPPEPMVQTLAALESLPAGSTLLQINVRTPQFLLPLLEERGFTYEVREQEPGLVRVFIRHAKTTTDRGAGNE